MRKFENFLKSPWTISIGTSIFSTFLTIIYDYSMQKPILTTISHFFIWIWNLVSYFLNFNVKIWWLLVGIVIFILIRRIFINLQQNNDDHKPDFCQYREDTILNWRWEWRWRFSSYKKNWVIENLTAHCPKCDTTMIEHDTIYGIQFECPRCNYHADEYNAEKPYKIAALILDNINRKRNNT